MNVLMENDVRLPSGHWRCLFFLLAFIRWEDYLFTPPAFARYCASESWACLEGLSSSVFSTNKNSFTCSQLCAHKTSYNLKVPGKHIFHFDYTPTMQCIARLYEKKKK